jgi:hypothetical protein
MLEDILAILHCFSSNKRGQIVMCFLFQNKQPFSEATPECDLVERVYSVVAFGYLALVQNDWHDFCTR